MSNQLPLDELKRLKPANAQTSHLRQMRGMTEWFNPLLLLKLLKPVIVSELFGQYADRRLMVAALDQVPKPASSQPSEHVTRAQELRKKIKPHADGSVWLDYVSDLGDGFDPTYAVAHALAQPKLKVGGNELPRGDVLVMGGDEVYPTALRDDYILRTKQPYRFALPGQEPAPETPLERKPELAPIPLYAIPGNHDWYDGLVMFLAIFCRSHPFALGRWETQQRRSYFAAQLTDKVWLWGIDIALVRDMDQPQADYFVEIAKAMPEGASIILCGSEPGWYDGDKDSASYRTLGYAVRIADDAKRKLKIPLILSGDSHHYARYETQDTQFITSGGGGAFAHGTHHLRSEIELKWKGDKTVPLEQKSCYPDSETSKSLLSGNKDFYRLNKSFSRTLSFFYFAAAYLFTLGVSNFSPSFTGLLAFASRWDIALIELVVLCAGFYGYTSYQNHHVPRIRLMKAVFLHALGHWLAILVIAALMLCLRWGFGELCPWTKAITHHWLLWAGLTVVPVVLLAAPLAGKIFGWNLLITSRDHDMNHNDAFSSMRLEGYKNFLRIKIHDDQITVYPVKLEKVPARDQWIKNPERTPDNPSTFVPPPQSGFDPEPIESPIIVSLRTVISTDKPPPG